MNNTAPPYSRLLRRSYAFREKRHIAGRNRSLHERSHACQEHCGHALDGVSSLVKYLPNCAARSVFFLRPLAEAVCHVQTGNLSASNERAVHACSRCSSDPHVSGLRTVRLWTQVRGGLNVRELYCCGIMADQLINRSMKMSACVAPFDRFAERI